MILIYTVLPQLKIYYKLRIFFYQILISLNNKLTKLLLFPTLSITPVNPPLPGLQSCTDKKPAQPVTTALSLSNDYEQLWVGRK